MEVSLLEILDAREKRVQTQRRLLDTYQKPLLCFTMNIPGPEKLNRDVKIGFFIGNRLLTDSLKGHKVLHRQIHTAPTGCEAFYVVDMPARELKQLTIEIEDSDAVGRLFDMDVLDTDGQKLDRESLGFPRRKCLICEKDAVICGSSRAHSVEELQDRTGFLLYLAGRQHLAEFIAVRAYLALTQEVSVTPKPGLVDRVNQGSHRDMNIRHFFASANALRPFFCRFSEEGYLTRDLDPKETFRRIRPIGMEAEKAMFAATGGVNTHKGAIFSLGILCAAAGRLSPEDWQPETILSLCADMTEGVVESDFAGITEGNAKTVGERLYALYGITGVRGQAEHGFPAVKDVGLPVLQQGLAQGLSLNDAGAATLLHLLAATDDTNLIARSDRRTQLDIQSRIATLLDEAPFPVRQTIEKLDSEFIEKNLSAGGSADLLALCFFLLFLCDN